MGVWGLVAGAVCLGGLGACALGLVRLINLAKHETVQAELEVEWAVASVPQEHQAAYMAHYGSLAKRPTIAVLLALFLGGLGAHRFYLGQTRVGMWYLLFSWTGIPALIAFVETFTLTGRVIECNRQAAREAAVKINEQTLPDKLPNVARPNKNQRAKDPDP